MPYLTALAGDAVLLHIYVQPKASKSRIVGLHDGMLKVAVAAPPVDGKANEEVVRFLARLLAVPVRDIAIQSGAQAKRKKIRIAADPEDARRRIEEILGGR